MLRYLIPILLFGCETEPEVVELPGFPEVEETAPVMRRLTQRQYQLALEDLFGEGLIVPDRIEPDLAADGFRSIGAAKTSISNRGVEQYEAAAFLMAEQAVSVEHRAYWIDCAPTADVDPECAAQVLSALGLRAWRRPLAEEELDALVALAGQATGVVGDFHEGLSYAVAALLQSPNFLFRVESGAPDENGNQVYTDYEMASRLAFFLWNRPPDLALLSAAERGELTDDVLLDEHIVAMVEDDRAREGVRNFFDELYTLYELEHLSKDPTLYPHMSDKVGPSAREQTLKTIEEHAFADLDFHDLFTSRTTYVDRTLASIYAIPAPAREGHAKAILENNDPRVGLLGHVGILAQHAHPVSTSPTLRGKFVRETVLCHIIPDPPADVDTSIPEPSGDAPTLRDRVNEHLQVASCASCHALTDPIGLGFENFDSIGRFRTLDNGVTIDASGDLDGDPFSDFGALARLLSEHPDVGPCVVDNALRYGLGRVQTFEERPLVETLEQRFSMQGSQLRSLMADIARSPAFRRTTAP